MRLIDYYSDSGVNSCVTSSEMPALHTSDAAAAVLCQWCSSRSQVSKATDLSVHTFDLKSAYKQIGLHRDGRETAYVAVYCPDKKTSCFFQALVFRFGSTSSCDWQNRCGGLVCNSCALFGPTFMMISLS